MNDIKTPGFQKFGMKLNNLGTFSKNAEAAAEQPGTRIALVSLFPKHSVCHVLRVVASKGGQSY